MIPALGKLRPGDHESRPREHNEFSPDHTDRHLTDPHHVYEAV